jgi:hypothetical protein
LKTLRDEEARRNEVPVLQTVFQSSRLHTFAKATATSIGYHIESNRCDGSSMVVVATQGM